MSAVGFLETLLGALPDETKRVLVPFTREAFTQIGFGPASTSPVAAENLKGHLVPYTTSSVANREVAVAHRLPRVPGLILTGLLDPSVANMTTPTLTVSRAADATNIYIKSASVSASGLLYVE